MNTLARTAPMLIVMGAVFFLSHQSGDTFDLPLFPGADKLAHLVIYAMLAGTIILALPPSTRRDKRWFVVFLVVLVSTVYGLSDEFHQSFIPGRSPSIFDVGADFAGALAACLLWLRMSVSGESGTSVR